MSYQRLVQEALERQYPEERKTVRRVSFEGSVAETYRSEKELIWAITEAMKERGWLVYHIGQVDVRGNGSSPGVPDLLLVKPALPPYPCVVKLIEAKFDRNTPTTEQQKLIDAGASFVTRSVAETLAICGEV